MTTTTTILSDLRTARLNRGLKQAQAGELLNMSRTAYNRLERGRVEPKLFTRVLIARHFGLDPISLRKKKDDA